MSKTIVLDQLEVARCTHILKQLFRNQTQHIIDLVSEVYLEPKLKDPEFKVADRKNIAVFFQQEANLIAEYVEEGSLSQAKKLVELFVNIGDARLALVQIDIFFDVLVQKQEFLKNHRLHAEGILKILNGVFPAYTKKLIEVDSSIALKIEENTFC